LKFQFYLLNVANMPQDARGGNGRLDLTHGLLTGGLQHDEFFGRKPHCPESPELCTVNLATSYRVALFLMDYPRRTDLNPPGLRIRSERRELQETRQQALISLCFRC